MVTSDNSKEAWIIYDAVGGFDLYGDKISVATTLDHFCMSFLRFKKAKILVIHADQLSYRQMAGLFEGIAKSSNKVISVTFMSLFSNPRKKDGDKGAPMLFFCRGVDVLKNFNHWKAFENKSGMSIDCFFVLPPDDHFLVDIGTFAATPAWNQPYPYIAMQLTGGGTLKDHCLRLNNSRMHKRFTKRHVDVLDLVK